MNSSDNVILELHGLLAPFSFCRAIMFTAQCTDLFAGAEDQDKEAHFVARVAHVGRMLQTNDADVSTGQRRQIASGKEMEHKRPKRASRIHIVISFILLDVIIQRPYMRREKGKERKPDK